MRPFRACQFVTIRKRFGRDGQSRLGDTFGRPRDSAEAGSAPGFLMVLAALARNVPIQPRHMSPSTLVVRPLKRGENRFSHRLRRLTMIYPPVDVAQRQPC